MSSVAEIDKGRAEAKGQDLPGRLAFALERRLIQFELHIHKTEHLLPTLEEEIVSQSADVMKESLTPMQVRTQALVSLVTEVENGV